MRSSCNLSTVFCKSRVDYVERKGTAGSEVPKPIHCPSWYFVISWLDLVDLCIVTVLIWEEVLLLLLSLLLLLFLFLL